MTLQNFGKLRLIVLQDLDLQRELQKIRDRDRFISRLIEIGRERGLPVESEHILEAINENRRALIQRWI